jgi:uridylate kinase
MSKAALGLSNAMSHSTHLLHACMHACVSSCRGQATTLKRNGSDFSATIMGALFRSGHITIWTDVDGVYSADPRKVPEQAARSALRAVVWQQHGASSISTPAAAAAAAGRKLASMVQS